MSTVDTVTISLSQVCNIMSVQLQASTIIEHGNNEVIKRKNRFF